MTPSTVITFCLGAVFGGMVTFILICLVLWGNKI